MTPFPLTRTLESHSTLELTLTGATVPQRTYFLATADLIIDGTPYEGDLREASAIKQSITRAANRTEVTVENVTSLLGSDWINNTNEIQGAKAKVGRYWRDVETGQAYHEILFRGIVQTPTADQDAVKLQILSDINASSIGGGRRVARKCQWKFRDPNTCTYTGVELDCNKLLNSTGGCSGRSNQHHFGGFVFIQPKSSVSGQAVASLPPNNQIVQTYATSTYVSQRLQPNLAFEGFTITNDNTNQATRITNSAPTLAEHTVIQGSNPSLELRDTDGSSADFIFDLNSNVLGLRFVGGGTMMSFSQTSGKISVQTGTPLVADTLEIQGGGGLRDSSANEVLTVTSTGSAVNELTINNAATGNNPTLNPTGGDANIGFNTTLKGTGARRIICGSASNNKTMTVEQNDGTPRIQFGTHNSSSTNGQITFGNQTPTDANYGFLGNTTDTVLNTGSSSGIVSLRIANAFSPPALQINGASGNAIGINRSTPGAMVDILSTATSRIGLIVDMPSSPSVDIAQFKVNGTSFLVFKNSGQIVGVPKCIRVDTAATGNVGGGLDSLHTFSLPANSLAANNDYVDVTYSGTFASAGNNKRIVINFGGQVVDDSGLFDVDTGSWTYTIRYVRISSTTVRFSLIYQWGLMSITSVPAFAGSGRGNAANALITVSDLAANAMTMLVQGESGGSTTDDVVQRLSIIELTQNS